MPDIIGSIEIKAVDSRNENIRGTPSSINYKGDVGEAVRPEIDGEITPPRKSSRKFLATLLPVVTPAGVEGSQLDVRDKALFPSRGS